MCRVIPCQFHLTIYLTIKGNIFRKFHLENSLSSCNSESSITHPSIWPQFTSPPPILQYDVMISHILMAVVATDHVLIILLKSNPFASEVTEIVTISKAPELLDSLVMDCEVDKLSQHWWFSLQKQQTAAFTEISVGHKIKTGSELKAKICELKLPRRKCYVGLREATLILSKSLDDKSTNLMMVLEVWSSQNIKNSQIIKDFVAPAKHKLCLCFRLWVFPEIWSSHRNHQTIKQSSIIQSNQTTSVHSLNQATYPEEKVEDKHQVLDALLSLHGARICLYLLTQKNGRKSALSVTQWGGEGEWREVTERGSFCCEPHPAEYSPGWGRS